MKLDLEQNSFSQKMNTIVLLDACVRDKDITEMGSESTSDPGMQASMGHLVSLTQLHLHLLAKLLKHDVKVCLQVLYLQFESGSLSSETTMEWKLTESLTFLAIAEIAEMMKRGLLSTGLFLQLGGAPLLAKIVGSASEHFMSFHKNSLETLYGLLFDGIHAEKLLFQEPSVSLDSILLLFQYNRFRYYDLRIGIYD